MLLKPWFSTSNQRCRVLTSSSFSSYSRAALGISCDSWNLGGNFSRILSALQYLRIFRLSTILKSSHSQMSPSGTRRLFIFLRTVFRIASPYGSRTAAKMRQKRYRDHHLGAGSFSPFCSSNNPIRTPLSHSQRFCS